MLFTFKRHVIDADLPDGLHAQSALADLDNDGRPEYAVGQQGGDISWYKMRAPGSARRCMLAFRLET